jgi:DNA polymerase II large subunit
MAQAYCVKDKKNGKPALQGTCPECGAKVFRIGG